MTYIVKPFVFAAGALFFTYGALASESVPVITGGVGHSSQQAIERVQGAYNLKLVFTGEGGMYLSDVTVSIRNKDGQELVNGVTQGPVLLTELPLGSYIVEAHAENFTQKRTIAVSQPINIYQIEFPIKDNVGLSFLPELEQDGFDVLMYFPG